MNAVLFSLAPYDTNSVHVLKKCIAEKFREAHGFNEIMQIRLLIYSVKQCSYEWQKVLFQDCGIVSDRQGMLDLSQGKVFYVLSQKLMASIFVTNRTHSAPQLQR